MRLPRRHYLKLAGVKAPLFTTLFRRDQVPLGPEPMAPFVSPSSDPVPQPDPLDQQDQWGYSGFDAFRLAVADALNSKCSISRDAAKSIANDYGVAVELHDLCLEGKEAWLGMWDFVDGYQKSALSKSGNRSYCPTYCFAGTLTEIIDVVKADGARFETKPGSILLLNVGEVAAEMRTRANEIPINFDAAFKGPFD